MIVYFKFTTATDSNETPSSNLCSDVLSVKRLSNII